MTHTLATLSKYQDWLNAIQQRVPLIWQQTVAKFGQRLVDQSYGQLPLQYKESLP
jgi:hypothetical protein